MPTTRSKARHKRSIFDALPMELVSYILDFLDPLEYTGLPCTCRRALEITNTTIIAQLGLPQDTLDGTERTLTAKLLRLGRDYVKQMEQSDCGGSGDPANNDL